MCWVFATLVVRLVGVEGADGSAVQKEDWETSSNNNSNRRASAPVKAVTKAAGGSDNQGYTREYA